jgi:nitrate reductase (cytochrome), electron transfer subunit
MKYLALIPLLCAGAITFCVTAYRADADSQAAPESATHLETDTNDAVVAERLARASHRAFYTAPPVIPHDLYPSSAGDCLTCHREEGQYFGKTSTRTPHPHLTSCTQCHLAGKPIFTELESENVDTSWKGLETPLEGTRAHLVAPPTMPHRKFLREDCQSCHSHQSPLVSMRGPHPERSSCTQCHVAVENSEFEIDRVRSLPTP